MLSSMVQQNLKNLTLRQLSKKSISLDSVNGLFMAAGPHEWTTVSINGPQSQYMKIWVCGKNIYFVNVLSVTRNVTKRVL
jgi:hypothetical protein